MRYLRYAAYAAGIVLLLIVAGVGILAATFDPNDYRPQIVKQVKDRTGRDLTVGDIGLTVFPKIGLRLEGVSLAENAGGGEFAGIDEARVHVAVLPLLSRQVVVDEVRIDGLRANLVKRADGSTNFDDLIKPRESAAENRPAPGSGTPMRFEVEGIRFTNGRVSWKDATTGSDVSVELSELITGRVAENQPVDVRLVARVAGVQPKLDVRTTLNGTLDFDLPAQRFRFAGTELGAQGSALDFTGIELAVTGDIESLAQAGRIAVSKLQVKGRAARADDRYDVTVNAPAIESTPKALTVEGLTVSVRGTIAGMQLSEGTLTAPMLLVNLAESRLLVERLALKVRGTRAADNVAIDLSAPALDLAPDRAAGESALVTVKLDGPQRKGDISLRLTGVEGSAKALRIAALTLGVDVRQQDNAIKGELSSPVTGNLEGKVYELSKLAGALTVTSPAVPQKTVRVPVNGSVRADLGKERVAADLTTRFDESGIKAKGGLTGFAKPAYDFDVTIDKLNLDRYMPPRTAQAEGAQKPAGDSGTEEPIDLSSLKPLDLKGALRVGQLQASNVKASNVKVNLRAKDGRLNVDPLSANLYGGSAKGTLGVDANINRFSVKQNLNGISIGPLLRDAADKDILEGKGTVALDVTTQGKVASALKKALNGTARMELRDGAVKGVDLAGAVRRVKSAFGAGDVEGAGGAKEKTDFSELTASFDIRNGIARNEDLNLKSPFIRVTGSGDVDIPQSRIDYVVNTAVVATMSGQGGRDLPELKGLTVPVRIAGPFDQLKYRVEFSRMVRGTGKEQLEAAKEAGREALKGAAGGRLREMLGEKGGQPAGEADAGEQAQQAAPKKPEDQIKDALKGLLR